MRKATKVANIWTASTAKTEASQPVADIWGFLQPGYVSKVFFNALVGSECARVNRTGLGRGAS